MQQPYVVLSLLWMLLPHHPLWRVFASTEGLCPTGWNSTPNSENCFLLISNASSWDNSEAACQNHSGHLAALTSVQELKYVQAFCRNISNGCWVGGHGVNSQKGFSWEWSDHRTLWNNSVFPGAPSPLNCSNSSCLNTNLTDFCTLVINGQVALVGDRCNTSHDFVCMLSEGAVYPFPEHLMYVAVFSIAPLVAVITNTASVGLVLSYMRWINIMNNMGYCNFEFVPLWVLRCFLL